MVVRKMERTCFPPCFWVGVTHSGETGKPSRKGFRRLNTMQRHHDARVGLGLVNVRNPAVANMKDGVASEFISNSVTDKEVDAGKVAKRG